MFDWRFRARPRVSKGDQSSLWGGCVGEFTVIATEADVDLTSEGNGELLRVVFEAKDVPLKLLALIEEDLPFYEGEWDDVTNSMPAGKPTHFEFYTDFVLAAVRELEPLWIEDAP